MAGSYAGITRTAPPDHLDHSCGMLTSARLTGFTEWFGETLNPHAVGQLIALANCKEVGRRCLVVCDSALSSVC